MAVYFDSSVFLAIFNGEPDGPAIRDLLRELKTEKVRIYTSMVTVQEGSVLSYRRGAMATDYHTRIARFARIQTLTKDIALTAAKFEAMMIDGGKAGVFHGVDNKRRKWDCFHVATALGCGCGTFNASDEKLLKRAGPLAPAISFSRPIARRPRLSFGAPAAPLPPVGV